MSLLHDIAFFFGGAFLTNAVPHLVAGLEGRPMQSPFAHPPGQGLSTSRTNAVWGAANVAAGWALLTQVVEGFVGGNQAAAVRGLVDLRRRTDANEASLATQELADYMTNRVMGRLLQSVASVSASSSKEELVNQLQNLEQIRLLDQTSPAYEENRQKIFGWLGIVPLS